MTLVLPLVEGKQHFDDESPEQYGLNEAHKIHFSSTSI